MAQSIVTYSKLKEDFRFDAEYFHPEKLRAEQKLNSVSEKPMGDYYVEHRRNKSIANDDEIRLIELDGIRNNKIFDVQTVRGWETGSSKRKIPVGTVIISRLRSYLRQVAINYDEERLVGSTELYVFKPAEDLSKELLFAYLLSESVQTILKWSQEGTNHPRFSSDLLQSLPFPDIKEQYQKEIVEKMQLSHKKLIASKDTYSEAERIVSSEIDINISSPDVKHTVVNHSSFADQTRFDAQWFSSFSVKDELQKKHTTEPLSKFALALDTGLTPAKAQYAQEGHPVLKMGALTNNGIDWSKIEYAVESYKRRAKKYDCKPLDLIFTSSAHSPSHIGKKVDIVTEVPGKFQGATFVGEVMRLRPDTQRINPYYLLLFLRHPVGHYLLKNCIRGQTAHIYPEDVEKIPVPVLDNSIQQRVAGLVEKSSDLLRESNRLISEVLNIYEEGLQNAGKQR